MASACLPLLFRAVEIDGVPYWDGGYLGNPVIFPFFRTTTTEDVLVVQINPLVRQATPTSSSEIMNRINEITFNSSLMGEFRAIEFVARLIDQGKLPRGIGPGKYRRINMHRVVLDAFAKQLDVCGKFQHRLRFLRDAAHQRQARGAAVPRRSISTTSACAAPSTCRPRSRPSGRDKLFAVTNAIAECRNRQNAARYRRCRHHYAGSRRHRQRGQPLAAGRRRRRRRHPSRRRA